MCIYTPTLCFPHKTSVRCRVCTTVSTMAALGLSMGSCFCLKVQRSLIEAVCSRIDLVEFLPTELRRLIFAVIRSQDIRPCPTYVGAVSVLGTDHLEFYFFIGSDVAAFESVSGIVTVASNIQTNLRSYFRLLISEDSVPLLEGLTVTWEPNILLISD
ncbi:E4-ORFA [Bat mastadenovirus A]|uniref:E4-ORFA n=1 Tax=Bat mastadenovirus A TaxID=1146877 RepID=A0A3G9ENI2_9ADEN|nr:E4-ORFA [Bat mastadenovirus A]